MVQVLNYIYQNPQRPPEINSAAVISKMSSRPSSGSICSPTFVKPNLLIMCIDGALSGATVYLKTFTSGHLQIVFHIPMSNSCPNPWFCISGTIPKPISIIPLSSGKSWKPADPTTLLSLLQIASMIPISAKLGSAFTLGILKARGLGPSTKCLWGLVKPSHLG